MEGLKTLNFQQKVLDYMRRKKLKLHRSCSERIRSAIQENMTVLNESEIICRVMDVVALKAGKISKQAGYEDEIVMYCC